MPGGVIRSCPARAASANRGRPGASPHDAGLRHRAERAVLVWGGLRGALTLALALALPPDLLARDALVAMAFGGVLFTLVVQGLTLPLLVRRCGLRG